MRMTIVAEVDLRKRSYIPEESSKEPVALYFFPPFCAVFRHRSLIPELVRLWYS